MLGILHGGRPTIRHRESFLARDNEILCRRWLSNRGPVVQEFEKRVAEILGVKHALPMQCQDSQRNRLLCNGTQRRGGSLPRCTFVAISQALQWQEITPIFCGVDSKFFSNHPANDF